MNTPSADLKMWHRLHRTGVSAQVQEIAPRVVTGFSVFVKPAGEMGHTTWVPGPLAHAQNVADEIAGCRPSCGCPPWSE